MSQVNKRTAATTAPKTRGRKKKAAEEEIIEEKTIQIESADKKMPAEPEPKTPPKGRKKKEEKIIVSDEEPEDLEEEEKEEIPEEKEKVPEIKPPSKRGRKPKTAGAASKAKAATPAKPKENKQFHIILESITPEIDTEKLSKTGGRFVGKIPNQAARKAFGKIAKIHVANDPDEKVPCIYQFSIQEYKNSGDGKEKVYSYEGTRTKLSEPKVIKSGETEYKVRYKTDLKSMRGKTMAAKKN